MRNEANSSNSSLPRERDVRGPYMALLRSPPREYNEMEPVGLSDNMRQWLDKYRDVTARVNDINDHAYGQNQNINLRGVSAFPLGAYLLQYYNS